MAHKTNSQTPSPADRLKSEAAVLVHDLHTELQAADEAWQRFAPNDPNIALVTTFANKVAEEEGDPALKLAIIKGYLLSPAIVALHDAQATVEEILARDTPSLPAGALPAPRVYARLELLSDGHIEPANPSAA